MSQPAPAAQDAPTPRGASAYRSALTPKQREAEVFAHATRSVRAALADGGPLARARAVADNRRLWETVRISVVDPDNRLPVALRAQLASLSRAVLRECDAEEPDLALVADVNETIAAALWN